MKENQKRNYSFIAKSLVMFVAVFGLFLTSCKEDPVPEDTTEPVAGFNFTADELTVTFVNTSTDADSYAWDFGDGQTSALETPAVVTYSEAGTYDVTLTATRDNGKTDEITKQVIVTVTPDPIAGFTYVASGLEVTFTNSSVNASSYEWNFGDESTIVTDESPVYTYAASGTYSVSLKAIEGELNNEISMDVVVIAPTASFTVEIADLEVTITNTSENATSYAWDYGDSNTSTEAGATHTYTYAAAGEYTITLIATDDASITDEASETVTVTAPPADPVANYTFGGTGLAITYTNTSTDAVSYAWDFGDGNISTEMNPSNTYGEAGVYMVILTVTGSGGDTDEIRQWVTVGDTGAPYFGFMNGTLDDYGLNAQRPSEGCTDNCITDDEYQDNNDVWEKPDHWTGFDGFRAGGMSSDGRKLADDSKTNGLKMANNNNRGAYQEVAVENGGNYTVTFDVAGDVVAGTNVRLDVYLVNQRIFAEDDANLASAYQHFEVLDTDLTGKGNWITLSWTGDATSDVLTFYMLETIHTNNSSTEVWVDNITLTKN